jgi:hypothetical protein
MQIGQISITYNIMNYATKHRLCFGGLGRGDSKPNCVQDFTVRLSPYLPPTELMMSRIGIAKQSARQISKQSTPDLI